MKNLLTISPSPHDYSSNSVKKIMYGVIIAMLPALGVSIYFFGLGAVKVTLVSVIACLIFEWIIQKYLIKGKNSILDGSAIITGMLLAFNLPSNLPCWIIVIGALVSIGIGKMSFGGLGNNPFNPALVGRVFLLISFPVNMTSWPNPGIYKMIVTDAETGATPLGMLKESIGKGETVSEIMSGMPDYVDFFIGKMGGSLGEISAIAIIIGGIYLLYKKIITWQIPLTMLASMAIFQLILWRVNPERYADPIFHMLTGGALLGAFFMATDMVTSPMTSKGMIIFGLGIGILTTIIRNFGVYPEGVSFAILIMNGLVPLINMLSKPKRFGEAKVVNNIK